MGVWPKRAVTGRGDGRRGPRHGGTPGGGAATRQGAVGRIERSGRGEEHPLGGVGVVVEGVGGVGANRAAAHDADDAVTHAGGGAAARRGDAHGGRDGDTDSHEGHDAGQMRTHAVQGELRWLWVAVYRIPANRGEGKGPVETWSLAKKEKAREGDLSSLGE